MTCREHLNVKFVELVHTTHSQEEQQVVVLVRQLVVQDSIHQFNVTQIRIPEERAYNVQQGIIATAKHGLLVQSVQ
jgi:hypothetical protein